MRKGLFAIVLVAASFAGGATVNGPGLRWVRDILLNHPGTEITTTTLGGDSTPDPELESERNPGAAEAPVAEIPARPIPPLVIPQETLAPAPAPSSRSEAVTVTVKAAPLTPRLPAPEPPRAASSEPKQAASLKSPEASKSSAAAFPSGFEPPAPLPLSKDRDADANPPRPSATPAPLDPGVSLATLPSDSGPPHLETQPDPSPVPVGRTSADWAAIRRRMHELGVARYGIEGEPAGRVRFHCVIPLAGRRAVGQQFEAEGDDELEAAQTALRRVALWRTAENPPSPSTSAPTP